MTRFRAAVLVDGRHLPAWAVEYVSALVESGVEVAAFVGPGSGVARGDRRPGAGLGYRAYRYFDRRITGSRVPHALVPLAEAFPGVEWVEVEVERGRFSDDLKISDELASIAPDVVLRLGFRILKGDILSLPPAGVWSFHHGDVERYRGGPPGYWEVVERESTTGVTLQVLNDRLDGGLIVGRLWVTTHPWSPEANRARALQAGSELIRDGVRTLREVGASGFLEAVAKRQENTFAAHSRQLFRSPSSIAAGWHAIRLLVRRARASLVQAARPHRWSLRHRLASAPEVEGRRFTRIPPPPGVTQADPWLIERDGSVWVFFEELKHGGTGRIVARRLDGSVWTERTVALDPGHHVSYPCLFEWQDDLYMVPESLAVERLDVYRCERFPDRWTLEASAFHGQSIADPTVVQHDGLWYLFCGWGKDGRSASESLRLFVASDPVHGPWAEHPESPVRRHPNGSRPAGALFVATNGALIRPAQSTAPHYGAGVEFFQVLELTSERFVERPVGRLEPLWTRSVSGVHSYATTDGVTVVDTLERESRLSRIFARFANDETPDR